MTHVLFFRGLNTYGHDHAQFSIIKFGPMAQHLSRELKRRDVCFHPIVGMGVGPLTDVAANAARALTNLPVWTDDVTPVHFFGHSAGGLIARLLLDQFGHRRLANGRPKIASLLTMATPHRGSKLAQLLIDIPARYPGAARFFSFVRYDLRDKTRYFGTLTIPAVARVFGEMDPARFKDVRLGSVVCAPPRHLWSWPMRGFYLIRAFKELTGPSDGMVERDSQVFGREVFEIDLDHFQQAGFFGQRREFARLCDVVAAFAKAN